MRALFEGLKSTMSRNTLNDRYSKQTERKDGSKKGNCHVSIALVTILILNFEDEVIYFSLFFWKSTRTLMTRKVVKLPKGHINLILLPFYWLDDSNKEAFCGSQSIDENVCLFQNDILNRAKEACKQAGYTNCFLILLLILKI